YITFNGSTTSLCSNASLFFFFFNSCIITGATNLLRFWEFSPASVTFC
ncbi:hypothetical protein A2U01_0051205, partial [Trifolium medium]|nr:hypothetical protein [Trifolium medium]